MRIKEKIRKIKNRLIDSKFLFTHSHLMRNMVESIEDELISQNGKKDDILYISFYPQEDLEITLLVLNFWMKFPK